MRSTRWLAVAAALAAASPGSAQVVHEHGSSASFTATPLTLAWHPIQLRRVPGTVLEYGFSVALAFEAAIDACNPNGVGGECETIQAFGFVRLHLEVSDDPQDGATERWVWTRLFDETTLGPLECHTFVADETPREELVHEPGTAIEGVGDLELAARVWSESKDQPDKPEPPVIAGNWCVLDGLIKKAEEDEWSLSRVTVALEARFVPTPLPPDVQVPTCEGVPNSTGRAARLSAGGSNRVADDELFLSVEAVPPETFGYFLLSRTADRVPGFHGGRGLLCLGPPLVRLPAHVVQANERGQVAFELPFGDLPLGLVVLPGETWQLQFWYRDHDPEPTHNLSSGLALTFG